MLKSLLKFMFKQCILGEQSDVKNKLIGINVYFIKKVKKKSPKNFDRK